MSDKLTGLDTPSVPSAYRYGFKTWFGMNLGAWQRLLVRNRFAVGPAYLHLLPLITLSSLRNSALQQIEQSIWGRRIERTRLTRAPLFVVGHWRSGTTLLHNLLNTDRNLTAPNTYQCFFPNHFLVSERYSAPLLRFTLPSERFSDRVALGWDQPMEDEFALCNMGAPSPYLVAAFPNRPQWRDAFALDGLPPRELDRWRAAFTGFLKKLTLRDPRRIVLKSPTHTYRLKILVDIFPQAQFIHIVRNPFDVFRSTVHSTRVSYLLHALQQPRFDGLEESVLENFLLMHQKLEEARPLLTHANFYEVRYENLVANPAAEVKRIYDRLGIGNFEAALPGLEKAIAGGAGYTRTPESMGDYWRGRVKEAWGQIIERYGYET